MSKKDEALELALVAERVLKAWDDPQGMPALCEEMKCLREALAEPVEWLTGCPECGMDGGCDCDSGTWNPPAQQEPVAVHQFRKRGCSDWYDGYPDHTDGGGPYEARTLYASPQSKPWVGLTDEDDVVGMARDAFAARYCALPVSESRIKALAEAIEAKLREKNA